MPHLGPSSRISVFDKVLGANSRESLFLRPTTEMQKGRLTTR